MGVCDSTTIVNLDVAVCALQSATAAEQRKMMTWSICAPFSSPFVERERARRACAFPIRDMWTRRELHPGPTMSRSQLPRCVSHAMGTPSYRGQGSGCIRTSTSC